MLTTNDPVVPFVGLYDQLSTVFSTMQVSGMKAVEHEDTQLNDDFSVDPLADPRLDKMDLFGMVDTKDRDKIMSASDSYSSSDSDFLPNENVSSSESLQDSGSGE